MATVEPFHALHYDLDRVGGLTQVASPPYDVIDAAQRAQLAARSPHNVVAIDLPRPAGDADPYEHAAHTLAAWRAEGVVVADREPALWALQQDYTGPDGRRRTRRGLLARVRIEPYGPGRIRPHERTHPGPKEDRLRLTRATRANLSPIFSLYDDPAGAAWDAVAGALDGPPWGELTDADGTEHRVWRVGHPEVHARVSAALAPTELLIADGHHRYETARVYAEERGEAGGELEARRDGPVEAGPRSVLMCLVALQDPGLTVFPTHRLLTRLDDARRTALRDAIMRDWEVAPVQLDALEPVPDPDGRVRVGYLDAFHRRGLMLTLREQGSADRVLPGRSDAYRRLDTAVLEALLLEGPLGMTLDSIAHLDGLDYARSTAEARERVLSGAVPAAFFMGATPVEQVRAVAGAGETMPPKSTYFFPKVPTGIVFNPLD